MWTYITSNFPQLSAAAALGFLINHWLQHSLAKSRSKEDFERSLKHKNLETESNIINYLGLFSNGLSNCWESGTMLATMSKYGVQEAPLNYSDKIEFNDYTNLKKELVELGVFTPKTWHSLDKLPSKIDKINEAIKTKNKNIT